MVKKNKVLIGCLSLLLVLSVGYALFSETITINGTATAKGSFDITTTCGPGYSDEFLSKIGAPEGSSGDIDQAGFENSICDVNGNMVTMTTDLLYPTATRTFTVEMTNNGSIPAIIWGATRGGSIESLDVYSSASYSLIKTETGEIVKSGLAESSIYSNTPFVSKSIFPMKILNDGTLGEHTAVYDTEKGYAGIKLNVGESIFIMIDFTYEEPWSRALSDNGKSEHYEFKLNHEFKWEQYTDNPNYEDVNYSDYCFNGC